MATKWFRLIGQGGAASATQLRRALGFSSSSAAADSALAASATSVAKPEQVGKKWGLSVLVLILPCAATFGLGSWQLVRREKKIELLNFRRSRFEEEPIAFEEALALTQAGGETSSTSDALQYRKVYCEGVFDESKSVFVGPRSRTLYGAAEKGYYIVTPLFCRSTSDERVQLPVLVNRGWVPASMRNEALAHEKASLAEVKEVPHETKKPKQDSWWGRWSKPPVTVQEEAVKEGTVRVAGVIRAGEQPNMFVPNNQPEIGQWFYVDAPAMAQTMGLPQEMTYMEAVADPAAGDGRKQFPLPKESDAFLKSPVMPQDHLNYALTWYSLSAATTFMAVKRLQSGKRGR